MNEITKDDIKRTHNRLQQIGLTNTQRTHADIRQETIQHKAYGW